MTIFPKQHTFAAQLATEQGYEFNCGSKRILYEPYKPYEKVIFPTRENFTRIHAYESAHRKASIIEEIKSYEELRKLGLVITIAYKKWYYLGKHRAYQYFIIPENNIKEDYGAVPPNHRIQHNIKYFCVRLVGPHASNVGYGKWVQYKAKPDYDKMFPTSPSSVSEAAAQIAESWVPEGQREDKVIKIYIDELPILENEVTHELYCIEQEPDSPIIAISGKRGEGKSFMANGLVGRFKWKWGVCPIIINDWQAETLPWCLPWGERSDGAYAVECKGEFTLPLPAVYLFLEGSPPLENIPYEDEVSFKISLPFTKLMAEYENFLKPQKGWKMDKIVTRLTSILFDEKGQMREGFTKCDSMGEVVDFVKAELEAQMVSAGGNKKGAWQMIEKITSVLRDINNKNFMDISNKLPAYWTVRKHNEVKNYPPWIACVYAGLVPIFVTNYFHSANYFPSVVKYVTQSIFEYQQGKIDPYFKNNETEVLCLVDELPTIASTIKPTPASEAISDIAAAGRMHRMGMVYVTQNYSLTPPRIRANTKFMFAFNQNDNEAKEIARDYNLSKEQREEMKSLKKFECMAMTTTSRFVVYDVFGTRRIENGPVKGIILHPLNQHMSPKRILEPVIKSGR